MKAVETGASLRYHMEVGVHSEQGSRPTQEDRYFILQVNHETLGRITLLSVIDGHCGTTTADIIMNDLPRMIISKLRSSPTIRHALVNGIGGD